MIFVWFGIVLIVLIVGFIVIGVVVEIGGEVSCKSNCLFLGVKLYLNLLLLLLLCEWVVVMVVKMMNYYVM